MDPGLKNFAACLLINGEPEKTFWVKAQQDVNNDTVFLNNIIELIEETKPDLLIAERYQFRGMQSMYTELVSQMLGRIAILSRYKYSLELIQISASQWKKFYNIKNLSNGVWSLFPNHKHLFDAIHQADAAAIGKYGYERFDVL
jgi:hypothetical protein